MILTDKQISCLKSSFISSCSAKNIRSFFGCNIENRFNVLYNLIKEDKINKKYLEFFLNNLYVKEPENILVRRSKKEKFELPFKDFSPSLFNENEKEVIVRSDYHLILQMSINNQSYIEIEDFYIKILISKKGSENVKNDLIRFGELLFKDGYRTKKPLRISFEKETNRYELKNSSKNSIYWIEKLNDSYNFGKLYIK